MLGLWLFLAGVVSFVVSSVAGWDVLFDIAMLAFAYPGMLLLFGSVAFSDAQMLWLFARRRRGTNVPLLSYVFHAGRAIVCLPFLFTVSKWELSLLLDAKDEQLPRMQRVDG